MVELPLLEFCGPVSSFRTSFIRRTAAVLTLKVAVDFEASQAGTRACSEARYVIHGIQVDLGIDEDFARKIERNRYKAEG